jgi:hypothetical protein
MALALSNLNPRRRVRKLWGEYDFPDRLFGLESEVDSRVYGVLREWQQCLSRHVKLLSLWICSLVVY